MELSNLSQILVNSKSHIDKTIYSYLFMLTKYIFFWKNGIKDKGIRDNILTKLQLFTEKINKFIIKKEEKFIKIEPLTEVYTPKNFKNIISFILKQNSMYAGDIMEGILIIIFSYAFETSKINEFGKYIYINIAKLRDVSNTELLDWFKKARTIFENAEMKDFKKLLYEDYYLNDVISSNYKYPLIHTLIKEVTKLKFNLININKGNNKTFEYINNGKLDLIKYLLTYYKSLKNISNNLSMIDKDFMGNSIAFIHFYFFEDPKIPPIKILRCFFTSVYIYYQNEHSPLMAYGVPYIKKYKSDEELDEIPFTYSLKGAFVEGRFSNTIISPIKIEPKICHINFGQNNIREWGLFELGKSISMNKNIKSLILKISLLRSYFLDFFVSGFSIYDNYSIENLNLSMNYIKEDCGYSLINLLSHIKNLKTLNLSANDLKGGARHIFVFLKNQYRKGKSKLENLYINNCALDESSFYELGELLKSKFCKLKKLSIGANIVPNMVNFLKKIKFNRNLEDINISKCGLKNKDTDDLCKIISNSNIKHLNLFKNELNNFDDCMNIVFRTKLVQKKNEIKKDEINKDYIIDKNSTLMTLDLSNNAFYSLNDNYIYLIKNLIEDNSTIGCLDLSHIFFGPYPDKSMKPKTTKYRNAIEKDLADTLIKRKEKFSDLSYKKRLKEIGLEDYKNKKGEEKLNFTTETINNEIKKIIQKPDDLNYDSYSNKNQDLYLKDQSSKIYEILKELKKNNVNNEDLKIFAGLTLEDLNSPQIKDDFVNKIVDYIKYKRDKEELTKYNHDLNDKNLILI